jgi:nucleotide-binding universal stress UspA family protein
MMPNIILLAIDNSKHSLRAAEAVERLAKPTKSDVAVIHVHETAIGRWGSLRVDDAEGDGFAETIVRTLTEAGIATSLLVREATYGQVAHALINAADDIDAEFIAVGSRGRSDIGSLTLGSVSHKLLHLSHRPVLVVPAV